MSTQNGSLFSLSTVSSSRLYPPSRYGVSAWVSTDLPSSAREVALPCHWPERMRATADRETLVTRLQRVTDMGRMAWHYPSRELAYFRRTNVPMGLVTTRPSSASWRRAFRAVVSATP